MTTSKVPLGIHVETTSNIRTNEICGRLSTVTPISTIKNDENVGRLSNVTPIPMDLIDKKSETQSFNVTRYAQRFLQENTNNV